MSSWLSQGIYILDTFRDMGHNSKVCDNNRGENQAGFVSVAHKNIQRVAGIKVVDMVLLTKKRIRGCWRSTVFPLT